MHFRILASGLAAFAGIVAAASGEAELTVTSAQMPRVPATEPAEALRTFTVKPGFHLELAAHEPLVIDPVTMCFDEKGRLFVVEMIDYSERREEQPHLGRVRLLTDTDGDGRFDRASVYADKLPWPTAVVCYDGGIFVGATPDIVWFKDRDDDGRADERRVVFTGFGAKASRLNVQALFNSFQWGLDNRIHGTCSTTRGSEVRRADRPNAQPLALNRVDFSFDPNQLDLRPETGGGQYGMSFDSAGRKFMCSNSDHAQMAMYDYRYLGRNPLYAMPSHRVSVAEDGPAAEVFRLSPDEPWRVVRTRWRISGVVRGMVEGGGRVSGYFTGASGLTVFQGDAYGPEFRDNLFVGDAGGNLVHRKVVDHSTMPPVARRPADEQGREFVASTDNWFRPVHFANGPDGCLYIADMYRETIEHPWSLPEPIKRHLDLNSGNDRGRVYRLAKDGFRPPGVVDLGAKSTTELVAMLGHANGWHRSTASRLLCQRRAVGTADAIRRACNGRLSAVGKIHAIHLLGALGELDAGLLKRALMDSSEQVRVHALKLSENVELTRGLRARLAALARDESVAVRYQLGLTLSRIDLPDESALIARLLDRGEGHDWARAAALNAVRGRYGSLFESMVGRGGRSLGPLARMTGASGDAEAIATVLQVGHSHWKMPGVQSSLAALDAGLRTRRQRLSTYLNGSQLARRFEELKRVALDESAPLAGRVAAVEAIKVAGHEFCGKALAGLLGTEVSRAALEALLEMPDDAAFASVMERWRELGDPLRRMVIQKSLANRSRARVLLAAAEQGLVAPSLFTPGQVDGLRSSRDKVTAAAAVRIFGRPVRVSIEKLMARYREALDGGGDANGGRALFVQRCASCHRAEGQGFALGPDLVTVKTKGRENLLLNLLNPNAEVAPQYIAFDVETNGDESFTAMLSDETPTHVTLRMANGISKTLPRKQVKGMRSSGRSLMPEGLHEGLTVKQMSDLLRFIETTD